MSEVGQVPSPAPNAAVEPARSTPDRNRIALLAVAGVALLALAAGAFVFLGSDDVGASQVTLRAYADPGPDPFTASVASDSPTLADYADQESSIAATGVDDAGYQTVDGTVPGVFGGSLDELACDADQLAAFLQAEPDKAAAWAGVLAIDVADVSAYIAGLTAANLTADTRVLDHGWSGDGLVERETVLQRGTAVMVDARGVPRVNCYSGNPLLEPAITVDETFEGVRWARFEPAKTVVIKAAPTDTTAFVLADVTGGTPFTRPVGSTGDADSTEVPPEAAALVPRAVTRELPDAGIVPLGVTFPAEITPDQPALIFQADVPAGSIVSLEVSNDRASISNVAVTVRSAGEEYTFLRVQPGGSETWSVTLDDTRSGLFDFEFENGPAAFEFRIDARAQDDAGSGADAPADFPEALRITSGQRVDGTLGDRDTTDRYLLDVSGAPSLELSMEVPRTAERRSAIELEFLGTSLHFERVQPGADTTFSLLLGPEDDDVLEFIVTEGIGTYAFSAELVPQRDGGQPGDAGNELIDARMLTGSLDNLRGEVGERDTGDLYLFEAPGSAMTLDLAVTPDSPSRVAIEVIGPDGSSRFFDRVAPGSDISETIETEPGEIYRLHFTNGRGTYVFGIS